MSGMEMQVGFAFRWALGEEFGGGMLGGEPAVEGPEWLFAGSFGFAGYVAVDERQGRVGGVEGNHLVGDEWAGVDVGFGDNCLDDADDAFAVEARRFQIEHHFRDY